MFKHIPTSAETVLKRAFNNWGIFGLYGTMDIIVKSSKKDNGNSQIEKKPLNDSDEKKTTGTFKYMFVQTGCKRNWPSNYSPHILEL